MCQTKKGVHMGITPQRFGSNAAHIKNRPVLIDILIGYLALETTENWLNRMEKAQLPTGPVNLDPAVGTELNSSNLLMNRQ